MTILIRALAVRGQKSVEPEFKVTTLKAGSNETTPKDCQNYDFAVDEGCRICSRQGTAGEQIAWPGFSWCY